MHIPPTEPGRMYLRGGIVGVVDVCCVSGCDDVCCVSGCDDVCCVSGCDDVCCVGGCDDVHVCCVGRCDDMCCVEGGGMEVSWIPYSFNLTPLTETKPEEDLNVTDRFH